MKKIVLFVLLTVSSVLSYAELPQFEVTEQTAAQQNKLLPDRINAAKQLIWVLPSNYYNDMSKTYWDNITGIFKDYFTKKGLKIVYYHTTFVPADNITSEIPGRVKLSRKDVSYSISNQKYYKYSDLIVFPELFGDGFNLVWKLTYIDVYQGLYWSTDLKLGSFSSEKQINSKIEKAFPLKYQYNPNYDYIRRGYVANYSEKMFKEYAEQKGLAPFEGIYQKGNQQYYVKKHGAYYYIVACGSANLYIEGDVKGELTPTSTPNIFLGGWNNGEQGQTFKTSTYVFTEVGLEFQSGGTRQMLIKVWPDANNTEIGVGKNWTGSGWSLKNGYVVTNNHVAEGAKSIYINVPINGETHKYPARVIALDKTNDLAILYVEDLKNINVPYTAKSSLCSVGEKCFALGYPMSDRLGQEVKLTDGVISSRTGFQNDMKLYQISAAVQPGNSGCPLFDEAGNVVGIVNSGVPSADNVGYAIKMSYLRTLLENYELENALPTGTEVQQLKTLPEKINVLRNYVYLIECSDTAK